MGPREGWAGGGGGGERGVQWPQAGRRASCWRPSQRSRARPALLSCNHALHAPCMHAVLMLHREPSLMTPRRPRRRRRASPSRCAPRWERTSSGGCSQAACWSEAAAGGRGAASWLQPGPWSEGERVHHLESGGSMNCVCWGHGDSTAFLVPLCIGLLLWRLLVLAVGCCAPAARYTLQPCTVCPRARLVGWPLPSRALHVFCNLWRILPYLQGGVAHF